MLGKNTILKAIHNKRNNIRFKYMVWMLGKNTILKAIHNQDGSGDEEDEGVNAG